jgi:hypothetical protein
VQIVLRRFWTSEQYQIRGCVGRLVLSCAFVALLAYITAFMETLTISGVRWLRGCSLIPPPQVFLSVLAVPILHVQE